MLQNKLFTFSDIQTDGPVITTDVQLIPSHPIFGGHFPGQPILPGVCMMQMVKELLEVCLNKPTQLLKADDLKFLAFVVPEPDKLLQMELKINTVDELIKADARLLDSGNVLFKFKGTFKPK